MTKILDCSIGEGGGSLVRISVALAAATASSLDLINIRSKRSNPGLRAQHLEAISAISQLSGLSLSGSHIGSQNLNVRASKELQENDEAVVNIKTAGSVALVAQAVLYYAFSQRRNMSLKIIGGATHGKWAPSIEYMGNITHTLLKLMNKNIQHKINKYGFYPKGGAECLIEFQSHEDLSPLNLCEKGKLEEIKVFSIASDFLSKREVAERQINSFIKHAKPNVTVISNIQYVKSLNPGSGLTIINQYSSGSLKGCFVPGERNLSSEQVGKI
ncbi:MAG: RNA 3'-terminal phosphate cyclase, partial [Candidatus Heimdallarchaeaceae archaeon]